MPKYQAPNHVNSVSVAGVEYKVENGLIEAPYDVQTQIAPLGFTLLNEHDLKAAAIAEAEAEKAAQEEEQRKADEAAKVELAAQKKAEAEAKKQATADEKARVKAEAEAKVTENTSSANQE